MKEIISLSHINCKYFSPLSFVPIVVTSATRKVDSDVTLFFYSVRLCVNVQWLGPLRVLKQSSIIFSKAL